MTNATHPLSHLSFRLNQSLFDNAKHDKKWLGNLQGMTQALWLTSLTSSDSGQQNRLKVVVTRDQNQLNQLETELAFSGVDAHVFPDWETLTYDELSPHHDIVSERIHLLTHMPTDGILLISVQTLMHRVAPASWLLGQHFDLSVGDTFDVATERRKLATAGYHAVDNVFEPGEFAVRGSVIDLFAIGQPFPVRIDLFDDEIESIRFFNPQTQRSLTQADLDELKDSDPHQYIKFMNSQKKSGETIGKITSFQILPAREFPLDEGKETFRANFASTFANTSARRFELFNDVMNGIAPAGVEYYQPLFFDTDTWQNGSDFFSYLPKDSLFIVDNQIETAYQNFWQQIQTRYNDRRHDIEKPIVAPQDLYLAEHIFNEKIAQYPRIITSEQPIDDTKAGAINALVDTPPDLTVDHKLAEPLQRLMAFREQFAKPILLVAETAGRREILSELLQKRFNLQSVSGLTDFLANMDDAHSTAIALTIAPIERGALLPDKFAIISETQLFGRQVLQTRRRRQSDVSDEFLVKSVSELNIGDPVVHIYFGIGRYQGLITLEIDRQLQEFIHLTYADDASVYVPVANLQLISRYAGGDAATAPLHTIGSGKWDKAKAKALSQIHDVAAELLNVQARRDAKVGINFPITKSSMTYLLVNLHLKKRPTKPMPLKRLSLI